jgi:putative membrane protein
MALGVLFWVAVVVAIIWAVKQSQSGGGDRSRRALRILEERYARGEIGDEEFTTRKRALGA